LDKQAHAVLFRGINLGKHNKLPMPALRAALEAAGYRGVATLFQSGNLVVADDRPSDELAAAVHDLVVAVFGLDVPCLAVGHAQLRQVVEDCPMPEVAAGNGKTFNVVFVSGEVTDDRLAAWDPRGVDPDNIRVGRRVVYQWCPQGFHLAPQLLPKLEQKWGVTGTVRNWNTTTRLLDLVAGAEAG
jgi:uncharacterized protein (DUF1697 family)